MKKKRQDTILSLIAAEEIPTQEVLRERMEEHGFAVTQATLSRDIRELKLTKERRGSGRACYTAPVRQEVNGGILQNAAPRTDFAGNVAVIHCRTGTAQAVAAALDAMHREDVVGTIAGDDTIFILLRSEEQAAFFAKQYAVWMQTEEGETIC